MSNLDKVGKIASIRYRGGIKGEKAVDDHSSGSPLTFMIGNMQLPKGIEEAVCQMEVGQQCTVEIPPELGYGQHQEKLASWRPKNMVDDGYSLSVGNVIFWSNPNDGRKMPVWVTDMTDDNIKLDFNHPFAGKTLEYWIELVDMK